MIKSHELPTFLANYGPSFARTAYLLTGDADRARELAVDTLTAVGRRWSSVRWGQPVSVALRELYGRYLGVRVQPAAGEDHPLGALRPRARAAVVAQFHDGLPPQQAAAVTGLWIAVLTQETQQARTTLRAARPDLFPTETTPEDAPPRPAPQEDPADPLAGPDPRKEAIDPAAGPDPREEAAGGSGPAQWAAPWGDPGLAPRAADTPWTVHAQVPAQVHAQVHAQDHASAWDVQDPAADDPGLRAALIRIAAGMPHVHLSEPVLRRITRRRRIRAATWTAASLASVGALVALTAAGLTAVARNVERASAERTPGLDYTQTPEQVPDALPAKLSDPVRYAYQSYCQDAGDPSDPEPCGQWRLSSASGKEWRLPGVRAGYDKTSGATLPLAVSQDGHRLAYRDTKGAYVVRDLPTGKVKRIDVRDQPVSPHLRTSPNGRFVSVDFGASDAATLDFETGVTHHDHGDRGDAIRVLAVHDDGSRLVTEQKDVDDVPGHASITTMRLGGSAAGAFRIDPGLVEYGGALSPDGHTLALVTQDSKVIAMDARTGRVTGRRTALEDYEVLMVERWISADEVLVRQWDDDYAFLTKVNVRSGTAVEYAEEVSEWLDYDSPLGALED
ncbi:hypothetical protein [Nonomuraea zeae]|uniref:Uncharacterized protein n=1 Tax=Nonomuraea zeae TaxID=1642303 RepID=A0A5S4G098_9ACTN|nr:hypothetical protein [Nonomuraea zeae]TMR25944.1 hypothetical protein ETD85_44190 [Nonomuraea zeae]